MLFDTELTRCLFVFAGVCYTALTQSVCERERKRVREIQPELSVTEFKARARVTGQTVMRRRGKGGRVHRQRMKTGQ